MVGQKDLKLWKKYHEAVKRQKRADRVASVISIVAYIAVTTVTAYVIALSVIG